MAKKAHKDAGSDPTESDALLDAAGTDGQDAASAAEITPPSPTPAAPGQLAMDPRISQLAVQIEQLERELRKDGDPAAPIVAANLAHCEAVEAMNSAVRSLQASVNEKYQKLLEVRQKCTPACEENSKKRAQLAEFRGRHDELVKAHNEAQRNLVLNPTP